jgi:hypothetical protein
MIVPLAYWSKHSEVGERNAETSILTIFLIVSLFHIIR